MINIITQCYNIITLTNAIFNISTYALLPICEYLETPQKFIAKLSIHKLESSLLAQMKIRAYRSKALQ